MSYLTHPALALAVFLWSIPLPHGLQPPSVLEAGRDPLVLNGSATRAELAGLEELYTVALYLPEQSSDRAWIASPETPKALRIEIVYDPDLRRPLRTEWRTELVPALQPTERAFLRDTFASLTAGDIVVVSYAPGRGTRVSVNERTAVEKGQHDLMAAFLDLWVGQTPISEEIKAALLGRRPAA